jgi:hypothetical protein
MKVLNLQCSQGHGFEGWFGNEDDYQSQQTRGLLACPLCGDAQIIKLLSAPRLNLSGARRPENQAQTQNQAKPSAVSEQVDAGQIAVSKPEQVQVQQEQQQRQQQGEFLQAVRHMLANTTNVGERFAEEARRMHYGETEMKSIRGKATHAESEALREEGIEFMSMPIPQGMETPLQ